MAGSIDDLRAVVSQKWVPVPLPDWANASVDAVEEIIEVRERDASSCWAGFIKYTDANNKQSARRIVCRKVEGYGRAETIAAYCCERKAHRRFRIDRISELVALDTGEVLDPLDHFEQLRLHGALKINDKALNDFARALVFMAWADNDVHHLEVEAIDQGIERYIARYGGDTTTFETARRNAHRLAPDGEDFVQAIVRLHQHPEARSVGKLLQASLFEIIHADNVVRESEAEWARVANEIMLQMAA